MTVSTTKRDDDWQIPLGVAVGLSLLFHVVGIPLLMFVLELSNLLNPVVVDIPQPIDVDITVQEPEELPEPEPEPEEEPEPEPEAEPEPEPPPEPPPRPPESEPEPPPPAEEPPEAPPEPVDFTGLTLTGNTGSGFAVVAGDGSDREGPLGPPPTRREPEGVPGGTPGGMGTTPGGTGMGPRVVAMADLSRRPRQPDGLAGVLRENYPDQARSQGVEGRAFVRVRVNPDGSLSQLRVVSESPSGYGFGRACMQTLRRGARFQPALDRQGNPVATVINRFPCTFSVRY